MKLPYDQLSRRAQDIPGKWRVSLSADWLAACDDFGQRIVECYAAGANEASRVYAMNGIDRDPEVQSFGKQGEVALCLLLGGDPRTDIEWRLSGPGIRAAYDIRDKRSRRTIDVKTIERWKRRLIWPRSKNAIFDSKQFDVFALMLGNGPEFEWAGWIEKAEFRRRRLVAFAGSPLQEGTRFLDRDELNSPDDWVRPPMPNGHPSDFDDLDGIEW